MQCALKMETFRPLRLENLCNCKVQLHLSEGFSGNQKMQSIESSFAKCLALCLASLLFLNANAKTSPDALVQGFQNPPDSAKPQAWWHWMNGNVTPHP